MSCWLKSSDSISKYFWNFSYAPLVIAFLIFSDSSGRTLSKYWL